MPPLFNLLHRIRRALTLGLVASAPILASHSLADVAPATTDKYQMYVTGNDGKLYTRTFEPSTNTWGAWYNPISQLTNMASGPFVAEFFDKTSSLPHILYRRSDNEVMTAYWYNNQWNIASLQGQTKGRPTAFTSDDQFRVYVWGMDNRLWERVYNTVARQWGGWQAVPGTERMASAPSAVALGDHYYVFYRRDDNQVMVAWFTGGLSGHWRLDSLGGTTYSAPAAQAYMSYVTGDTVEVKVRGTDNNLWTNRRSDYGRFYGADIYSWSGFSKTELGGWIQSGLAPSLYRKQDHFAFLHQGWPAYGRYENGLIKLSAFNNAGLSNIRHDPAVYPRGPITPVNVRITNKGAGTMTVAWNKVNGAEGYRILIGSIGCQVTFWDDELFGITRELKVPGGNTTSIKIDNAGICLGSRYQVRVSSYQGPFVSAYSAVIPDVIP